MKYVAILALLLSASAFAEDVSTIKYGVGVANSGKNSLSETKFLSVGRQMDLWSDYLIYQWEVGGWADIAGGGRRSSAFGAGGGGFHVNAGHVYAQSTFEVALVTNPDSYLGGPFQFSEDVGVGLQSNTNCSIGVNYKHISSAGLEQPNVGRDFLTILIRFPL